VLNKTDINVQLFGLCVSNNNLCLITSVSEEYNSLFCTIAVIRSSSLPSVLMRSSSVPLKCVGCYSPYVYSVTNVNTTAFCIMAWITYLLTCSHIKIYLLIKMVSTLKRTNMNDRLKDFTDYCTYI
jgi:hypothetical protein